MCDYKVGISGNALVIMDIRGRELLRDNKPNETWNELSNIIHGGMCSFGLNIEIRYTASDNSLVITTQNGIPGMTFRYLTLYLDFASKAEALEFAAKVSRAMVKLAAKK